LNRLLIVATLVVSTVPLYAQAQQPDTAKLKTDAQKVVSIISGDKAKTQAYCQIAHLGEQINREKDSKKAEALFQKMSELEKRLGPEYLALIEATNRPTTAHQIKLHKSLIATIVSRFAGDRHRGWVCGRDTG
jgi:hypothetical protein